MAANVRYKLDDRKLQQLIRQSPGRAKLAVKKLGFEMQAYWMTHMSARSPSAPGQPPAVVTGNLKNSSSVAMVGAYTAEFRVGAAYAEDLEFGTMNMAPRPSIMPALEETLKLAPDVFKAVIEEGLD